MKRAGSANGLRGILFDMDGVLCDSAPFLFAATARLFLDRYGVVIRQQDVLPYFGRGEVAYVTGAGKAHGVNVALPDDLDRVYEHYYSAIAGAIRAFDGVPEFIRRAEREGIKLAVASSADRRKVRAHLTEINLPPERFHAVVTVEDVERPKPAPDIFRCAAHRLGLAPEHCLVVEDAPSGIRAAVAAGCRCLGITTGFPAAELIAAGADATLPGLAWDAVGALFPWGGSTPRGRRGPRP